MRCAVKRKVCGVGINDAGYPVAKKINGKQQMCPFYCVWKDMLRRCYSEKFKARNPTYKECSVCDEWLTFSNFKAWMETQDWQGNFLDKDILSHRNKEYSPQTCIFTNRLVNNFFTCEKRTRGYLPIGVFKESTLTFRASISFDGNLEYLGTFSNPLEAFETWASHKIKQATILARDNPKISEKLLHKTDCFIREERAKSMEILKGFKNVN